MSYKNYKDTADDDYNNEVSNIGEEKHSETRADDKITSKPIELSNDELIDKFQEFFFGDELLAKTFEKFIENNAHIVNLESDEYLLEYSEVYERYKQLFEDKLENYIINTLKISIENFYKILKDKTDKDPDSNEAIFGQILSSITDFDVFMMMLKEKANDLRRK